MYALNLPSFDVKMRKTDAGVEILDPLRRKYIRLTPEEWVRQHTVHYLIHEKGFLQSHINVEKSLTINGLTKRYDIIVHRPDGGFYLLVECKEPSVTIDQKVFDQIARYNMVLNSDFLMVTNGINHYYCKIDSTQQRYLFLKDIPKQHKS